MASNFFVKNGKIYDPNGNLYIAAGINAVAGSLTQISNNAQAQPLTTLFPGVNHVRIPVLPSNPGTAQAGYPDPSSFLTFVEQLTGYNLSGTTWTKVNNNAIVVGIEDHNQGANSISLDEYTGEALTVQLNWYAAMAAYYAGNPYVWICGPNEIGTNDYSQAQIATASNWEGLVYNAIRGAGNNNMIQLMCGVGGSNIGTVGVGSGFTPSTYAGMTNIVWELHSYYSEGDSEGNPPIYTTAMGYVQGGTSAPSSGAGGGWGIIGAQTIQSADGLVPVIIGEWGSDSGNPNTNEAAPLAAAVTAVQAQGVGSTAWAWWEGGGAWACVNGNGQLSTWGQEVAAVVAAAANISPTPPVPPPTPPPPPPTPTPGPATYIVSAGTTGTFTDSSGNVWGLTAGLLVTVNGVVQNNTYQVFDIAYINGTVWQQNQSYQWYYLVSVVNNATTWSSGTATNPITSWPTTRNYWDHPGGSGSVWNTPFGSGAVWGAATDADTVALASTTPAVNQTNFGLTVWVSMQASDPTASFTGTGLDYENPSFSGSGTPAAVTAHIVPGSYAVGPIPGGDNHYCFFDNTGNPTKSWDFFGLPQLTNFQAGQGPFGAAYGGFANAVSDLYGQDWETGLNSPTDSVGCIRGYDVDPARNPARIPGTALTAIQHVLHYALPSATIKPNANTSQPDYPNGFLNPNSWPRRYQDYQSGVNVYSGTAFVYGTTLGIPQGTAMPTGLTNAGQQLWWTFQNYGGILADQAGTFALICDQTVPAAWVTQAGTDWPKIVPYLRPLRNQHQSGQSFTTYPAQGPGSRVDTGPRPVSNRPITSANNATVTGSGGGVIIDSFGTTWSITTANYVAVDGTPDLTLSNVAEIAIVSNNIWAKTTANLWQYKFYPSDNWSASTATSPITGTVPPPTPPTPTPPTTPGYPVIVSAGMSGVLTDASGNTWGLTNGGNVISSGTNNVQVVVNGVVQTGTANVLDVFYYEGVIWHQNNSFQFYSLASLINNQATWTGGSTTNPVTVWAPYRNYWDHIGGNGSVWNTPFGSGAVWGLSTDADTQTLTQTRGTINSAITDFGAVEWVSNTTSDPTASFSGTGQDYENPSYPGSGEPCSVTAHVITGSYASGPFPADNGYNFFDLISYPTRWYLFFGIPSLTYFEPGQGPFNVYAGSYENATSDLFGMDWQTGLNVPSNTGAIHAYDLDPLRNPARIPGTNLPQIQHALHYGYPAALLKPNANPSNPDYPNGFLNPNSWPRLYQDYQSGINVYTGTAFVYGTTLGIPFGTPIPAGLSNAGIQLFYCFMTYGGINADQAGNLGFQCDQNVPQAWINSANNDFPTIQTYLRPLRNQHQGGQSFVTNPMQGPGTRVDAGPRPVSNRPLSSVNFFSSVGSTGPGIVDQFGSVWTITSAGNVAFDGHVDLTISGAKIIAYVNDLVWVETTANLWYSKTYPSDNWSAGTSTSPLVGAPMTYTRNPSGLLAYFASIMGKGVVSGQYVELQAYSAIQTIANSSGKTLGIIGGDYWHFGGTGPVVAGYPFNTFAIEFWDLGGLVMLSSNMPNPTTGGASNDVSALTAADVLTSGTATNTAFVGYLNQIGVGIQALQSAGVTVMYRPFHESNGNWFWWGTTFLSDAQFVAMYQYTHTYMTTTMGLTNILWGFSENSGVSANLPVNGRYPGSSYIDIVGIDVYTDTPSTEQADYNLMLTYGKPFVFWEFGSGSSSAADSTFNENTLIQAFQSQMPNTVAFCQWWDVWGMQNMQGVTTALTNAWTINLNNLPFGVPTFTPSPNDTVVLIGSTATIVGIDGTVWGLTNTGYVTVNGNVDNTTSGVIAIAYVGGRVYQENSQLLWWSKAVPTDTWAPPGGSSTSPFSTPSPNNTVVPAGSTATIIGTYGYVWGITANGQVTVDGAVDSTTSNVAEIAYVNGLVYQETTSGLWQYKAVPTDVWAPTPATSVSPITGLPPTPPPPPPQSAMITITTIPNMASSVPFTVSGTYTLNQTTWVDQIVYEDNGGKQITVTSPTIALSQSAWSFTNPALPAGTHTVTVKDPLTGVVVTSNIFTVSGVQSIVVNAPSNVVAGVGFTFSGTLIDFATAPVLTYSLNGGAQVSLSGVTSSGWSTPLTITTAGTYTLQVYSGSLTSNVVTFDVAPSTVTQTIRPNPPVPVGIFYPLYDMFTALTDITDTGAAPIAGLEIITALPPGQSLTDLANNVWTIVGGVVLINGQAAAYSANVIVVAYVSGVIWQENTAGNWYYWTYTNANWTNGANPLTPATVGSWMNHYPYGGAEYTIASNSEAQYYTSTSRTAGYTPFALQNGVGPGLVITVDTAEATPYYPAHTPANPLSLPYNSGEISSCIEASGLPGTGLYTLSYGTVEVQALLPGGSGLWPKIILYSNNAYGTGELDIVQTGGNSNTIIYGGITSSGAVQTFQTTVSDFTKNRHLYGVSWSPSLITWYVDGNQYATAATPAGFIGISCYISIALAVQGSTSFGFDGVPSAATVFPSSMSVDFVRVSTPSSGNLISAGALVEFTGSLTNYVTPPSLSYTLTGTQNAQSMPITGVTLVDWTMQFNAPTTAGNYVLTVTDGTLSATTQFLVSASNITITPLAPSSPVAGTPFTFQGLLSGYKSIPALDCTINGGAAIALTGVTVTSWSTSIEIDTPGNYTLIVTDGKSNSGTINFSVSSALGTQVTWNPNDIVNMTLSNGNYTATATGSATLGALPQGVRASAPITSTYVMWEITFNDITANCSVGVATAAYNLGSGGDLGSDVNGIGFYPSTGSGTQPAQTVYLNNNQLTAGNGIASTAPAVITIAIANNQFYVSDAAMRETSGVNWNNSATASPATGVGGFSITGIAAVNFYPAFCALEGSGVAVLNDGTSAFSTFGQAFLTANPTFNTLAQNAMVPVKVIAPTTPGGTTAGSPFVFAGTLSNYTIPPTLTYLISPGGTPTVLGGVTATAWSTTVTIATPGTYTIAVTDGTHTGTTGSFVIGTDPPPQIGTISFLPANSTVTNSAVGTVAGKISVVSINGAITGITYSLNSTANFKITPTGQVQFNSASVATGSYALTVTVAAANATNSPQTYTFTIAVGTGQSSTRFSVVNGHFVDPNGKLYRGAGINISDSALTTAAANSLGQPLTMLFPGINMVRCNAFLASGLSGTTSAVYQLPSYYLKGVENLTGYTLTNGVWSKTSTQNIVVIIEDHDSSEGQGPFTGAALTIQLNWYNAMATYFAGNPYVWFGSQNEMGATNEVFSPANAALNTANQVACYNAIRGIGYASGNPLAMFTICAGFGTADGTVGPAQGFVASDYLSMYNIAWEMHDSYYSDGEIKYCNGTPDATSALQWMTGQVGPVNGALGGNGILAQIVMPSADGTCPFFYGEWGSSTGNNAGTDADQVAAAIESLAQAYSVSCTAWQWDTGSTWVLANLTTNPFSLTGWGQVVAGVIANVATPNGTA